MMTATPTGLELLARLLSYLARKERQALQQGNFDQLRRFLIIKGFIHELLGSVSEELLGQPIIEIIEQMLNNNTATAAGSRITDASRTRFSLKKSTLSSRHLIVARKFFFGEYATIEELLRQIWSKEVEKAETPIALRGLKTKFYTLLRKALAIIIANLNNPDILERLDQTQQEFYQKLRERFGTDLTGDQVTQFYEVKREQLLGPIPAQAVAKRVASSKPATKKSARNRGHNLSAEELAAMHLIFLDEDEINVNLVAAKAVRSTAWFYLYRDKMVTKVAQVLSSWEEVGTTLDLDNNRFYADLRIKYNDGPIDLKRLQTILEKRLPKGKRTTYAGKPIHEKTGTSTQTQAPRQAATTVLSRETIPAPDGDGMIDRIVLSPTGPPLPPRQPEPQRTSDSDREPHPSQYNLGDNGRRIVQAIFLEDHPSLLQVFTHLYSREAPTEAKATAHWREFYQRVDQPRRRLLALMRSVYNDNSLVSKFPPNEQATIRDILKTYPTHRDLESHSNSMNRPKASRTTNQTTDQHVQTTSTPRQEGVDQDPAVAEKIQTTPSPQSTGPVPTVDPTAVDEEPNPVTNRPSPQQELYAIPKQDLKLLRAVFVPVKGEHPSLNSKLIERRNRDGLVAEELSFLVKRAVNHLRAARQAQMAGQVLEEETEALLLNLQFIFFQGKGGKDWTIEEIVARTISLDQAAGRSYISVD